MVEPMKVLDASGNPQYDAVSPSTHEWFGRRMWKINNTVYLYNEAYTVKYLDGKKGVVLEFSGAITNKKLELQKRIMVRGHAFVILAINGEYITLRGV